MYDYLLGGFSNFPADREAAERVRAVYPDVALAMRANRAFLRRAVTYLGEQGITQFLDIGAGIPTGGAVHTVAQRANPAARVVYVDLDPIAVHHAWAMLRDNPHATAIQEDARQPEAILAHPEVRRLLDLDRPLGVLLVALLHFVPDDDEAEQAVRTLREAAAPGSYLALSHGTDEGMPPDIRPQLTRRYTGTANPARSRSRAAIARFFADWELVAPGLVYTPQWRPDDPDDPFRDDPARSLGFAGVGRKP